MDNKYRRKIWQCSLYSATLGLSILGGFTFSKDKVYADSINNSHVKLINNQSIQSSRYVVLSSNSVLNKVDSSKNVSEVSSHNKVNKVDSSKNVSEVSSHNKVNKVDSSKIPNNKLKTGINFAKKNYSLQEKVETKLNTLFTDQSYIKLSSDVTEQKILQIKESLEKIDKKSPIYIKGIELLKKAESMLDNWQFNGLGDWHYGDMSFHNDGSNELIINIHGVPHVYYKDKTYISIDIKNALGKDTYEINIIGDKNNNVNKTILLSNGDILHLFAAEPSRIIFNKDNLKTDVLNSNNFYYEYENSKLVNITDYVVLKNKLDKLFNGDSLYIGIGQKDITNLDNLLKLAKSVMKEERFNNLSKTLARAQMLLDKEQSSGIIANNQIQTKKLYSLNTTSIRKTNAEGRQMGTYHDRQSLGIILTKGATLKIRQINKGFKGKLRLRLLGDDSSKEKQLEIINSTTSWTEVTSDGDLAAFVDTPWEEDGQANIEYEISSGIAKKLPDYKLVSNENPSELQKKFIDEWNSTQAPLAIIEGYNIQLLAPLTDLNNINRTDLKQLLHCYDDELFPLYDYLTGITPNRSYNDHIQGRYFIKADKNGVGSAYYSAIWSAFNGDTIKPYLTMNWLPWHEIGHGYEFGSKDTWITDVFNNVYGTLFQNKYTNDFENRDSWVWHNNKVNTLNNTINSLNSGKSYSNLSYQSRLLMLFDLLSYDKANVLIKVNELNRELALNHSDLSGRIGTVSAIVYANYYHLNVIPYLKWIGIPVNEIVALEIENQHYQVINSLCNMVPKDQENVVAQALGWKLSDSSNIWNSMSLITPNKINNLRSSIKITLQVNGKNDLSLIKNRILSIYDGNKLIAQKEITDNNINLDNIPDGEYTAVISGKDGWTFANPYIKANGNSLIVLNAINKYIIDSVKNLFTNDTFSKVKDSINLDEINAVQKQVDMLPSLDQRTANLKALSKAKFLLDEIDIAGLGSNIIRITHVNNSNDICIDYLGGEPHSYFVNKPYVKIKVINSNLKYVYSKEMLGNKNYPSEIKKLKLNPGDHLYIYDAEGASQRYKVSDPRLKPYNKDVYIYQITPEGRLILEGEETAPVIKASDQEIVQGAKFDPMAHVSASDAEDGVLKDIKVTSNNVNVNKPGTYNVTYEVTDKDGKTTVKTIKVIVKAENKLPELGNDQSSKGLITELASIMAGLGLLGALIKRLF